MRLTHMCSFLDISVREYASVKSICLQPITLHSNPHDKESGESFEGIEYLTVLEDKRIKEEDFLNM